MDWLWIVAGLTIFFLANLGYGIYFGLRISKLHDYFSEEYDKCFEELDKNAHLDLYYKNLEVKLTRLAYLKKFSANLEEGYRCLGGWKFFLSLFNRRLPRLVKAVEDDWKEYAQLYKINPH